MDTKEFKINFVNKVNEVNEVNASQSENYKFSYYGKLVDDDTIWYPHREIKTEDGNIQDPEEWKLVRREIREYYDEWRAKEINKVMKKAGIATVIG